ncbi:hypothetical protein GR210_13110 [Rhizobium leguminosarum]|nr:MULTISPECIES: hypothetical protein [Rhizobium]MBY5530987.1 hypothetical protein [Rhizobium leguminosarum]NEH49716.1 hypothetical protein [Rhizobium leguminosarum]NEH57756.1 hypothetical protein [Rhizobium leguminosarum]NEJ15622.1 hypothetical protein [Rhizobium ruizarguesonis]NEK29697.1 hypothetical protein [Rhizobium ruizarguesonis]
MSDEGYLLDRAPFSAHITGIAATERAKTMPPSPEQDDPAKIGNSIVSLTCIKDHEQTSR